MSSFPPSSRGSSSGVHHAVGHAAFLVHRGALALHVTGRLRTHPLVPRAHGAVHVAVVHGIGRRRRVGADRSLREVIRLGFLANNPAANSPRPPNSKARPEGVVWTAAEIRRFLSWAKQREHRLWPAWVFVGTSGDGRRANLGVRWVDIDFDRATTSLEWTVTAVRPCPSAAFWRVFRSLFGGSVDPGAFMSARVTTCADTTGVRAVGTG